jgi:hypothetical protein
MSLAVCLYDLVASTEKIVASVGQIADLLDLSNGFVQLEASDGSFTKRLPFARFSFVSAIVSKLENYTISIAKNDLDETMLSNVGSYVTYSRLEGRGSCVFFATRRTSADLDRGLEDNGILSVLRAKYGFGTDWNCAASFWAYACGFQDVASLEAGLLGVTPAGRWGLLYRSEPAIFDEGHFRDIYPLNFLTSAHLRRKIPGGAVRDLISKNEKWGSITELTEDWFLWRVVPGALEEVKGEFESRKLLTV